MNTVHLTLEPSGSHIPESLCFELLRKPLSFIVSFHDLWIVRREVIIKEALSDFNSYRVREACSPIIALKDSVKPLRTKLNMRTKSRSVPRL